MKNTKIYFVKKIFFNFQNNLLSENTINELDTWFLNQYKDIDYIFNGKIIAIHNFDYFNKCLKINWYVSNYAHYLQRNLEIPIIEPAKVIFCSILIFTDEGEILIGKTNNKTETNSKLLLPGGNVEIKTHEVLSEIICIENICRETYEEIGLKVSPKDINIWGIKTGGTNDDLGIIYKLSKPVKKETIIKIFDKYTLNEIKKNRSPELKELFFIKTPKDLLNIKCELIVDYLPEVLKKIRY